MNTAADFDQLQSVRAFAEPLLDKLVLQSGEKMLDHLDAVSITIAEIGGSIAMQSAPYLAFACDQLIKPKELFSSSFGDKLAQLAMDSHRIFQIQRQANSVRTAHDQTRIEIENVRRMLLAFSRDIRVVIILMASQLQTLRFSAAMKSSGFETLAHETLQIYAPLANRLGVWQIKWELEDLSFRILEPETYRRVASFLDAKRHEREIEIHNMRTLIQGELSALGIRSEIQGRPKNIYSIVKKMRGKYIQFNQVLDLRALRIIVNSIDDCYRVLSWIHEKFEMLESEFDDYIAKPKSNGYQSLHTVVEDQFGKVFEIQVRTQEMHTHAEHGVAAHWAYKEAGVKGYAGATASIEQANKMAVLRQLLAWEREMAIGSDQRKDLNEKSISYEKIYVLTPEAAIIELPCGSTPVDFAYTLHTEIGHRCRGAKVDGVLVPLNTTLHNGQTVEITTTKDGGPSRDWLNIELGYVVSSRAKSKVRAWFNAQQTAQTIARGRDLVEKLLQREGRTAFRLETLAQELGFLSADQLFEVVGKDEFSLKQIEQLFRPSSKSIPKDELALLKVQRHKPSPHDSGVLVVGVDSLLTQLARCCRPVPPDEIKGYVTRGKGVSVHRTSCSNFLQLIKTTPDRVIDVAWGGYNLDDQSGCFPVSVEIQANDRQGLLRDISEVFAKEKMNVIDVYTQSVKGLAWMIFTIEVTDTHRLQKVLSLVTDIEGVRSARRQGG
jgi:GTP pyrophosphokinase